MLGSTGFGTCHVRLLLPPSKAPLALRIKGTAFAYRLWVKGALAAENGRIGRSLAEEVPGAALQLVTLPEAGGVVDLVFHVSNFHFRKPDFPRLSLGDREALEAGQERGVGMALFVAGTLFMMAFHNLAFFALRRSNPAPLVFGLYCLAWAGNLLCIETGSFAIRLVLPDLSGEALYRAYQAFYVLAITLSYQFLRVLYPGEFPRWILRVFWGLTALYGLAALFLPLRLVSAAIPWFHLAAMAKSAFTLVALVVAGRRSREGAWIILVGYAVLGILGTNDALNDMQLLRTAYLMDLGILAYMLAQSLVLSMRFSRLFTAVEHLSEELGAKNLTLEEEMAERSRLEREVLSVSEEERRRLSQELHDGLCQQLTGARLQCSVLECLGKPDDPQAAELRRLSDLLEESVDHAYDLSHGLWPVEHGPEEARAALADLAQRVSAQSGIPVTFTAREVCQRCLNASLPALYRIAQEAVANAVKHARPTRIQITLDGSASGCATLTVADDGIGRAQASSGKGGLGMRMMHHRARALGGTLTVEDGPQGGTVLTCTVPCDVRVEPRKEQP